MKFKLLNAINFPEKSIRLAICILLFIFAGIQSILCSNSVRGMSYTGLQDSVIADRDGNLYSTKVLLKNTVWMTTNLNLNIPDSYCFENIKANCDRYGRLYTWESAQKGCSQLGEGWRLPTDEEWQLLSSQYGFASDSIDFRKGAYITLLEGGSAGFNALLGGGRETDGKYARRDAHGFYWTTTAIDRTLAWYYNFGKGSFRLYRQEGGEKSEAFSVRCVRNIVEDKR